MCRFFIVLKDRKDTSENKRDAKAERKQERKNPDGEVCICQSDTCEGAVYSEDYMDLILDYNRVVEYRLPECVQKISRTYDVAYYPRKNLPPLNIQTYSYTAIPHCYTLTDKSALEASQILILQNQPALNLTGRGVLIGFVDTGIDYQNPLFRYSDGRTRIQAIWDQTIPEGTKPEGFLYGSLFTGEKIDEALLSAEPLEIVPTLDEDGHGTFLAGVAAGGENLEENFIGAAPESMLAVVKCKQAKQYLRDYYFIPDGVPCYQSTDLMAGVAWLTRLADERDLPLVICIGMGSSQGAHDGGSPLPSFLNEVGLRRRRVVTIATGNEANARHHYWNRDGLRPGEQVDVEIFVGEGVKGFTLECWAQAPELYRMTILSPTGELLPTSMNQIGGREEYTFLFENTSVSVDYGMVGSQQSNQLIFLRMEHPLQGIWTLRIMPAYVIRGEFHMWLPVTEFLSGEVFFLRSNPDMTATEPAYALTPVSVGAYQTAGESIYAESGRGFSLTGNIKPQLAAPGVDIQGPGLRQNFVRYTGTSAGAAITAGACAQLLQWGIVDGNYPTLNSTEINTILIRGAKRSPERSYPNTEWGFGSLDVYSSLNRLRNTIS